MSRGNLIGLKQLGAQIAIDTYSNANFSDFEIDNGIYTPLNNFVNWRFYLKALSNFSSYYSNFSITHSYKNASQYNISITLLRSNFTYSQTVNVTDSKFS